MISARQKSTLLILAVATVMTACSGGLGSGIPMMAPGGRSWEIAMSRLKVVDAQEDRSLMGVPLSDGDEPYIIMFGVQSTFGTANSTEVRVNNFEDDEWGDHLKAGQQRQIPIGMGSMRFQDVMNSDVVGIVVVALESDRTPWAIMRNRIEEVQTQLQQAVARSVENRREADFETTAFIDEMHQAMQDAVGAIAKPLTTGQALENIVFSGVDTDEVVGINSMIFMRRPPSRSLKYPHYRPPYLTDVFANRDFVFNSNAIVFQNSNLGAKYEAEMRVREF